MQDTGIGKRIKEAREKLKLTQEEFAKGLNKTRAAISAWEKGKLKISKSTIKLIEKVYSINPVWLETGQGEMFKDDLIPVVYYEDYSLSAGYGIASVDESDEVVLKISDKILRDKFGKKVFGRLIAFKIKGNSMFPTLKENAIGVFTDFRYENIIIDGEIYAIAVEDTFYVKRLVKDIQRKKIILVSDNKEYPVMEIENNFKIIGRLIATIELR